MSRRLPVLLLAAAFVALSPLRPAAAEEEPRIDLAAVSALVDAGEAATVAGDAKTHRAYLNLQKSLERTAGKGLPGDLRFLRKAAQACAGRLSSDGALRDEVSVALGTGASRLRAEDAGLLADAGLLLVERNRERILAAGLRARRALRAGEFSLFLGEDAHAGRSLGSAARSFARTRARAARLLEREIPKEAEWSVPLQGLGGALLSVWGESGPSPRLYAVGADDGEGAQFLVLHPGAEAWVRVDAGGPGTSLRWVSGVPGDGVWACGDDGRVVRYDPETGTLDDRSTGAPAIFYGLWGSGPSDVWVVGGDPDLVGPAAVLLHWDGDSWQESPLPGGIAGRVPYKILGIGSDDLWVVGRAGLLLHGDGESWTIENAGTASTLVTIHGGNPIVAVGGGASAVVVERTGEGEFHPVSVKGAGSGGGGGQFPSPVMALLGVHVTAEGEGLAVGYGGAVVRRTSTGWVGVPDVPAVAKDLHAVWMDDEGNAIVSNGNLGTMRDGSLLAFGRRRLPTEVVPARPLEGPLADLLYFRCAHSGCHLPPFLSAGVSLASPEDLRTLLVGVPSEQSPLLRVAPGRPSQSYLMHKLLGTHESVGGSGDRMPVFHLPGDRNLVAEEMDLIRGWILDGAR